MLLLVISSVCASCTKKTQSEHQLDFQNVFTSSIIIELFLDEILDVISMTESRQILIDYATYDLNDNGLNDLVVCVRSPLHSGSLGDSMYILENSGEDHYEEIGSFRLQMYSQTEPEKPIMLVSSEKINSYYSIIIDSFDSQIILVYMDGGYIVLE